jgi:Xaa-Pro dipeptidase
MKEQGADLLLVYGDSWRFGHLAFVSHFIPKNRGALAAVPLEGEPALVVQEPSRNNPFSKTLTWIDEVRSVGQFAQGLSDVLKARGLKPKRVGLVAVEEQLPMREWEKMVQLLAGADFCDLSDLLTSLRLAKSASEQALLRYSAEILEQSLALFKKEARAGQKEYEIAALAEREARRQGAEDFRFLIARGSDPQVGLRPVSAAPLHKGEALLVTVAASYQRYWGELGRTFCLGRPPAELLKSHGLAKNIFSKLVESVKLGSSAAAAGEWLEIPSAPARESVQAYGLGNGLGLDPSEEPFLGRDVVVKIQPGMALTLRVCLAGEESGHGLIAQPFLSTENGLQSLAQPAEELVVIEG